MSDPVAGRWSAPFVAMFESLGMGPRLQRGRRDARAGHVRSLTISSSLAVAQVRGPDEPLAQRARIAVRAFGAAEWAVIEQELAGQARYVADLLAGRVPEAIGAVVVAAGLRLLPDSIDEVAMDCTCQQWPMPCPHLAAACYALARSFDDDPFGALAWRGRGRDELLDRLRELRGTEQASAVIPVQARPGLGDLASFWSLERPPTSAPRPVAPTPGTVHRPDALLDQLDAPPLSVGGRPLTEVLRSAYRALGDEPEPG